MRQASAGVRVRGMRAAAGHQAVALSLGTIGGATAALPAYRAGARCGPQSPVGQPATRRHRALRPTPRSSPCAATRIARSSCYGSWPGCPSQRSVSLTDPRSRRPTWTIPPRPPAWPTRIGSVGFSGRVRPPNHDFALVVQSGAGTPRPAHRRHGECVAAVRGSVSMIAQLGLQGPATRARTEPVNT
jgi:hypothetical protein